MLYDNGGNGTLPGMLAYYDARPSLRPDLMIVQGGENDTFNHAFKDRYLQLLALCKQRVILGDWYSDDKSAWERSVAESQHIQFVDLRAIQRDPANSGDGGRYRLRLVASHPNDVGMKAISLALESAIEQTHSQFKR